MLALALTAVLALPQGQGPVSVNEVSYDDAGVDDEEFVELFNAGTSPVDLSGWRLVGRGAAGTNRSYTLPRGTTIAPAGLLVAGAPTVPGVGVVLTRQGSGSRDLFENGPHDGILLVDAAGRVVDRLDYLTYASSGSAPEGGGFAGACVAAGPLPHSLQRLRDGLDTDDNGADFRCMPRTPGTSNGIAAAAVFAARFDARAVGSVITAFGGTFARATVVDPTIPGPAHPAALPPSPQGGLAASFAAPASSGNHVPLLAAPLRDVVVECWAWIEGARPSQPTDAESWTLGVRGTADASGDLPFVDPRLSSSTGVTTATWKSGCTGIAWVHQRTAAYDALFLVDWNNGGDDFVVLHVEPVVRGVNDGWQRLTLRAVGDRIDARFGNLQVAARTTTLQEGGVHVTWGEFLLDDRERRAPLLDDLRIDAARGSVRTIGTGTPHTRGLPRLDVATLAYPGSARFALVGSRLLPRGNVGVLTGFGLLTPPLDLARLGAQPGALLLVRPDFGVGLVADAGGDLRLPLGIPDLPALVGANLGFQALVLDPALPYALRIATTPAVVVVVSN